MTDLSGRVLELEKDVLALPNADDFSNLATSNSSRFNSIDSYLRQIGTLVDDLHRKVLSLSVAGINVQTGAIAVYNEIPGGAIDGSNNVFSLAFAPNPTTSLMLFRDGLIMSPGAGNDYVLSSATITLDASNAPQSGSNLRAFYTR